MASQTLIDHVRNHLAAVGLLRAPDVAGAGARPWLPPAWRHPDGGAVGPGDAADQGRPDAARDDGLVVSIFWAPGIPPAAGEEDRRIDGIDFVLRGNAVPPILALDAQLRMELHGIQDPGGRSNWVMDGLYVVQAKQYRPLGPIEAVDGVYTFSTGYLFETRVA